MKYIVKARGYGGSGPSVTPFITDSLQEAEDEAAELLDSDHSVQIFKIVDGKEQMLNFETFRHTTVYITE
jgi:hypothetical protein